MTDQSVEQAAPVPSWLITATMTMHAAYLLTLAVALFGVPAIGLYWLIGKPAIAGIPGEIAVRFAILSILVFGVAALATGVAAKILQNRLDRVS